MSRHLVCELTIVAIVGFGGFADHASAATALPVSLHAAGRGHPWVTYGDGHEVPMRLAMSQAEAYSTGDIRSLSLASSGSA